MYSSAVVLIIKGLRLVFSSIAHRLASLCICFVGISILTVVAATLTSLAVAIAVIYNYLDSGYHLILIYTYILSCYRWFDIAYKLFVYLVYTGIRSLAAELNLTFG